MHWICATGGWRGQQKVSSIPKVRTFKTPITWQKHSEVGPFWCILQGQSRNKHRRKTCLQLLIFCPSPSTLERRRPMSLYRVNHVCKCLRENLKELTLNLPASVSFKNLLIKRDEIFNEFNVIDNRKSQIMSIWWSDKNTSI